MAEQEYRRSPSRSATSVEEENLFLFCKQMVKKRVFQGSYQERRYVEHLKGYRDLVVLHSNENDLKIDLRYVKNRIDKFYNNRNIWIGISLPEMIGTPAGLCVWTEIENLAFGEYWFQIKSIRFKANEVFIKLKALRPVSSDNMIGSPYDENTIPDLSPQNLYLLLIRWKNAISESIMWFLSKEVNKENIVGTLRFISLLLLSLMTGALELIKFLGVFTIRFSAEIRILLRVATPIIMKILDIFNKVIGGIFILLAMVWRDIVSGVKGKDYQQQIPTKTRYQALTGSYYSTRTNNRR